MANRKDPDRVAALEEQIRLLRKIVRTQDKLVIVLRRRIGRLEERLVNRRKEAECWERVAYLRERRAFRGQYRVAWLTERLIAPAASPN